MHSWRTNAYSFENEMAAVLELYFQFCFTISSMQFALTYQILSQQI